MRVPLPLFEEFEQRIVDFHTELVTGNKKGIDKKDVTVNNLSSVVEELLEIICEAEAGTTGYKERYAPKLIERLLATKLDLLALLDYSK